ncbi:MULTISPECIES: hypothetical protein [Streptomyces]|uniref:Secreted protein n=1 Tax=Streptomyces luteosporeus TaxID=173856 RepID=A0ABN3U0C6_9ACTN
MFLSTGFWIVVATPITGARGGRPRLRVTSVITLALRCCSSIQSTLCCSRCRFRDTVTCAPGSAAGISCCLLVAFIAAGVQESSRFAPSSVSPAPNISGAERSSAHRR